MAFAVLKDPSRAATPSRRAEARGRDHEAGRRAARRGGAAGARALRQAVLPKTRSGKLLRRAIQAVCEQRATRAT
jgi:propionyl-CoA synthetase